MRYAIIENGTVVNVIALNAANAQEFPTAVDTSDRPAGIGDTYADGRFYRDGVEVLTPAEELEAVLSAIEEALNE